MLTKQLNFEIIKKTLPFTLLYFSANALFVYKYGARTHFGSDVSVIAYFVFLITALFFHLFFLSSKVNKLKNAHFAVVYFGMLSLFVVSSLVLLFKVDPYSVEIDRWSALHGFIGKLFSGEFPYLARTHLGNAASPLPVMNLIAIPFYLLGDVGYLQIFTFTLTAVVVFLSPATKNGKILFMAAFLASPAFWYEVMARSDMGSNFLIMCLGLLLIEKITNGKQSNRPIQAGCVCGVLFCTRGIFIIPFIVFFLARVVSSVKEGELRQNCYFAGSVIATFAFFLLPFVLWDVELFMQNNPFLLQTEKAPFIVQLLVVAIAALLSYNAKTVGRSFLMIALCLFALMGTIAVIKIVNVGWNTVIFSNNMDITYYSVMIPFIVLGTLYRHADTSPPCRS